MEKETIKIIRTPQQFFDEVKKTTIEDLKKTNKMSLAVYYLTKENHIENIIPDISDEESMNSTIAILTSHFKENETKAYVVIGELLYKKEFSPKNIKPRVIYDISNQEIALSFFLKEKDKAPSFSIIPFRKVNGVYEFDNEINLPNEIEKINVKELLQ